MDVIINNGFGSDKGCVFITKPLGFKGSLIIKGLPAKFGVQNSKSTPFLFKFPLGNNPFKKPYL